MDWRKGGGAMKVMELEKATEPLVRYVRGMHKEPIIFLTHGKPIAALSFIGSVDWETLRVSTHPEFLDLIEESRKSLRAEGGIPEEEMRRRLGIPLKPSKRTGRSPTRSTKASE
jgi:hypothetical protein